MRRKRRTEPPAPPKTREELEVLYPGQVWHTAEHEVVVRLRDNTVGTLSVQQGPPTLYFHFRPQPTDE